MFAIITPLRILSGLALVASIVIFDKTPSIWLTIGQRILFWSLGGSLAITGLIGMVSNSWKAALTMFLLFIPICLIFSSAMGLSQYGYLERYETYQRLAHKAQKAGLIDKAHYYENLSMYARQALGKLKKFKDHK